MQIRFALDLGQVWRRGEVLDVPDDTARALVGIGYADHLTPAELGGPGEVGPTDILTPDRGPRADDPGDPAR